MGMGCVSWGLGSPEEDSVRCRCRGRGLWAGGSAQDVGSAGTASALLSVLSVSLE